MDKRNEDGVWLALRMALQGANPVFSTELLYRNRRGEAVFIRCISIQPNVTYRYFFFGVPAEPMSEVSESYLHLNTVMQL